MSEKGRQGAKRALEGGRRSAFPSKEVRQGSIFNVALGLSKNIDLDYWDEEMFKR